MLRIQSPVEGESTPAVAPAATVGLSRCHNGPHGLVEVAPAGQLISVVRTGFARFKAYARPRGRITGFSHKARARMIKRLASWAVESVNNGLLVTLTYPEAWPADSADWKAHLKAWSKRFSRRFPGTCLAWKLEFQERGAPHFHVLIVGVQFVPHEWVAASWYEVVGSGDPRHLAAGTEIHRVWQKRQALAYISKYLGKVDQTCTGTYPGRYWGIIGRGQEPRAVSRFRLPLASAVALRRQLRRVVEHRCRRTRRRPYRAGWLIIPGPVAARLATWSLTL